MVPAPGSVHISNPTVIWGRLQLYSKLFSSCGFLIRLPLWGKSEEQYYFLVTASLKLVLQLGSTLASF